MNPDVQNLIYNAITGPALRDYFLEHVVELHSFIPDHPSSFYKVTKPLHVFKKVHGETILHINNGPAIVNLIIPVGAFIYAEHSAFRVTKPCPTWRKMRADRAQVHSIVDMWSRAQLQTGYSGHDVSFEYAVGETVTPKQGFNYVPDTCASGIHFFLNVCDALNYKI